MLVDSDVIMIVTGLFVALAATAADPKVDADQFVRLIHGLQADYHDVAMIFEGEDKSVGEGRGPTSSESESQYQGHYALRSDGASLLDAYIHFNGKDKGKGTYLHQIMATLGEETKIASASPDVRRFNYASNKRAPGQLNRPGSIERIFFLSYFRELGDIGQRGFEGQGWEDVDGHRCLRVQIDDFPGANGSPERHFTRLWIDMDRGGHPLKTEEYWGPNLVARADRIRLAEFPASDGKKYWLPAAGDYDSFLLDISQYSANPTVTEKYLVVTDSVRINDGLKDSQFRVAWKGGLPETEPIRKLRDLFESAPLPRSDAAGVKAHLDRTLKEADAQAERLEASSPARQSWNWTATAQVGLAGVGLVLLGGAGYRRWRDR